MRMLCTMFNMLLAVVVAIFSVADVAGKPVPNSVDGTSVEAVLRCYKHFQDKGKKVYAGYIGGSMILYDEDGAEVSCSRSEQAKLRHKYDRRCIFSPIHCLFSRRLKAAIRRAAIANELDQVPQVPFLYVYHHHNRHAKGAKSHPSHDNSNPNSDSDPLPKRHRTV